MPRSDLDLRLATDGDLDRLQQVRRAAFAPIFESFRAILGDEFSSVTQARDDEEQAAHLRSLSQPGSGWELYVAERSSEIVGFVSVRLDRATKVGEIGLNAVQPDSAGKGIGTSMCEFAKDRMRECGIEVATVSTGGDPSHAPARRAYEKAGFNVGIPSVWLCSRL
jgi:RimJ/RimL family protein N-acetyltransferase